LRLYNFFLFFFHILIFKQLFPDFKKKVIFNFFLHIFKKIKNYIIEKNLKFCLRFFSIFLILKKYFLNLKNIFKFLMTWPVTSAPRGQNHAMSTKKWGQGPFSNNFFLQGCNSNFFFTGTKIKTRLNYRNENHI